MRWADDGAGGQRGIGIGVGIALEVTSADFTCEVSCPWPRVMTRGSGVAERSRRDASAAAVFSRSTSTIRSFLATVVFALGLTLLGLLMRTVVRDDFNLASSIAMPLKVWSRAVVFGKENLAR